MAIAIKAITSCQMPSEQKLQGSNNWHTWQSTLLIYFKLLKLDNYFLKLEEYQNISEDQKNQALLLIRQNLSTEPLALVFNDIDPSNVLKTLQASYEGTGPVIRQ